jgi:hypothetical protein
MNILLAACFLGLLFDPKDGDSMFSRNVSNLLPEEEQEYCMFSIGVHNHLPIPFVAT